MMFARAPARRASLAFLLATGATAACAGGGRDVVPESHDVHGERGADAGAPPDTYVHVAKRPHGVVALAEARGISDDDASAAVDHLADELDACAARLAREGKLTTGAARVVAQIGADGIVAGLNIKAESGGAVAANLLVCVIGPLRRTVFPPREAGATPRGMAIETEWAEAR